MVNTKRKEDSKGEMAVASFLDKNFYPNLKKIRDVVRVTSIDEQLDGIDVRFSNNGNKFLVDEKAALHYVDVNLPTFAFELNYINSAGKLSNGWLFDEKKKTTHYLLVWIKTKDSTKNLADISELEVLLISKEKVNEILIENKLDREKIKEKSNTLREKNIGSTKSTSENMGEFKLFYSGHLSEKPINIVINKKLLKTKSSIYGIVNSSGYINIHR